MSSAGDQGKFCVDCKHFAAGPWKDDKSIMADCQRSNPIVNSVSGSIVYSKCSVMRATTCGRKGILWESRYGDARP